MCFDFAIMVLALLLSSMVSMCLFFLSPMTIIAIFLMFIVLYFDVSENGGTPKPSNLIGISIINHPFLGTPIFGNPHI